MVTTRPMIRLSGFSRKTSFDGPSLSSSGCSSFSCPKRGSQQQLTKCDCDCGEANTLFRQQFLHQQQLLQRQHHQQHRNRHLVLLQLQAQRNKKVLKQQQQHQPHPQQIGFLQKRPIFIPHPPPPHSFRPTISESNSESDREGLEHFHRHLQQLHRLTCASVENAIYFGGAGSSSSSSGGGDAKVNKTKTSKSFSFRDIRDIGKKKRNVIPLPKAAPQPPPSTLASSSSSSSPLSPQPPAKPLKRRNTTRSAKDYIGVSRVKLLAKYWNKGRSNGASAGVDSGNGGSTSTSRSSDSSSDSQLSNYSSGGSSGVATAIPKSKGLTSVPSSNGKRVVISPRVAHKTYNNAAHKSATNSTVTYKVRYDIPSSWESEQLLSFADDHREDKCATKSKGGCSTSGHNCGSIASHDVHTPGRKNDSQFCTHCGRGPDASPIHSPVASPKPGKAHLLKNLSFIRPPTQKPTNYADNNNERRIGKPLTRNYPIPTGAFSCENIASESAAASFVKEAMMLQSKTAALARSKSQKCPERRVLVSPCTSPNLQLAHIIQNSKVVHNDNSKCFVSRIPKQIAVPSTPQPKVRFKEQQHHRSEQCLNDRSQPLEKKNFDRASLLRKWARKPSSSSTVTPASPAPTPTNKMLPENEREFRSLYTDCRIPRPKLRGIVPTHSYGVCSNPSSPVSGCSSNVLSENRVRRRGDFLDFTEISLQDDDSETSGFESEQNNNAATLIKDEMAEVDTTIRKPQPQKVIPADMTPAGKYFTDFKTLYSYHQDPRLSAQKSPTPSRVLSFRKQYLPAILSRSGKKKGFEDSTSAEFLKSLPIFRKLSEGFFAKLSDHISEISYENGSYLFHQGEKGNYMYFLVAGTAKATFQSLEKDKSEDIFLKTLHPGDFFGERAFQTRNGLYTHNVIATSDDGVTCVKIDREAYEELIYKCHDFKIRVLDRPQRKNKLPDEIAKVKLEDLRVVTTLGVGGFGRVELCTLASDCSHAFALKKMKKCQIVATRQIEHIRSEKSILLETNCDFICKLYKTFKDTKYLYMLMECCLGGELWTVLRDRGRFEDETAKFYIGCVIEALKYLHTRNIIYRDLKPENLLLDANGYVKLVDFGFAKKLDGRKTWTFCGTPEYCAPEIILNKGHDLSADFWSLGVLMYELLTGTPPFTGGDPLRTYKIILQGIDAIDFPPTVSKYALNLIRKLCRDNPADRLGAQRGKISDIKKHKWFDGFDWHGLNARSLSPPITPDVRGPLDFGNFDEYPPDRSGSPPDDLSGWDWDF